MGDRVPLPFPHGWFCIADSDAIAPGAVTTIRAFGQDLVACRGDDGAVRVVDPYCPHLGAHLGVGGTVVGNTLRCPFHHWRFDVDSGACIDIPYAQRIPPAARLRVWPTLERFGLVFAWYHSAGVPPEWPLPEVPEWQEETWSEPIVRSFDVRTHAQEMAENTVDAVHFHTVHGAPETPTLEARIDGHVLRATQTLRFTTAEGEVPGRIEIESHGCGLGITRFRGLVETLLLVTGLPLEDELSRTTIRFRVKRVPDAPEAADAVGRAFVAEIERQYEQDIPIWENKRHLAQPVLCDGDGPIPLVRQFFRQFYPTSET